MEQPADVRSKPQSGNRPMVICVLGPARSGTSMTARIINLMGFCLGPESGLSPPSEFANPAGFWEQKAMTALNNRLLRSRGGNIREPPTSVGGWATDGDLADLRTEARALLHDAFGPCGRWAWKDPRACFTLPFWKQLIPGMRYVLCVRNPLDVAASAHRWGGWGMKQNLLLWRSYMAAAVANTAGAQRIFVAYDDFFDDWREPARRLALFAECELPAETEARVEGFIESELRHHSTPTESILDDKRVPPDVAAMYSAVRDLASAPPEEIGTGATAELERGANLLAEELLSAGS